MQCDGVTNLTGDCVIKSAMEKSFDTFRKILQEQKLDDYFRNSCFGKYLDLREDNNARYQMTMVYGLLKRRFMYENNDKMDEVWINYCGMPLCFGLKEFAIVTGLKCHPPSQPIPVVTQKKAPRTPKTTTKKGSKSAAKTVKKIQKGKSTDSDDLVSLVGSSFKNVNLLQELEGKRLSKKHKQSLCLVWFVHNILWVRDVNNNIPLGLIKLSEDLEAFNNYPWGRESFIMTVKYLLTPLTPKTINLYGFPRAFMAWAFKAIPYLRQQVKEYQEEVSSPTILRWLSVKNDKRAKVLDLFKPPEEAIQVKCSCGEEKCPEWAILELQGVVEAQQSFKDRLQNLRIGTLCRPTSQETYTFTVGYHELTGIKVPLKKPMLVLKKIKLSTEEEKDDIKSSRVELDVIGVIRQRLLFKTRPKALISKPQPTEKEKVSAAVSSMSN